MDETFLRPDGECPACGKPRTAEVKTIKAAGGYKLRDIVIRQLCPGNCTAAQIEAAGKRNGEQ